MVKAAVVGGTGAMGKFFAKFLKEHNCSVVICSRDINKARRAARKLEVNYASITDGVKTADIVVVSVPITVVNDVCKEVLKYMKKGSTLIEVSSVKSVLNRQLIEDIKSRNIQFLSIHPLFGPYVRDLRNKDIVVIKESVFDGTCPLLEYFLEEGANLYFLSIDEHDKLTSNTQVVHHLILLAILKMYVELRKKYGNLPLPLSFYLTLKNAMRILRIRKTVTDVQKYNPYAEFAKRKFLDLLNELKKADNFEREINTISKILKEFKL